MNKKAALAEIVGLLCAEGCHVVSYCTFLEKTSKGTRLRNNKRSERIEFYNKDYRLLEHFRELIFRIFGYLPNITKDNKINLAKRKTIERLTTFTEYGHLRWRVPTFVTKGNTEIKVGFLRGYFDGDGTASNRVRFFSVNKAGLEEVANLLRSLRMRFTLQGPMFKPNRKPAYILQISEKDKEIFLNTIRPVSKQPGTQFAGVAAKQKFGRP